MTCLAIGEKCCDSQHLLSNKPLSNKMSFEMFNRAIRILFHLEYSFAKNECFTREQRNYIPIDIWFQCLNLLLHSCNPSLIFKSTSIIFRFKNMRSRSNKRLSARRQMMGSERRWKRILTYLKWRGKRRVRPASIIS